MRGSGLDRGSYLGYYVQLLPGACTNQGPRPPHPKFSAIEPTAMKGRNVHMRHGLGRPGRRATGRAKGQLDWSGGRKGRNRRASSQENWNWHEHLKIGDWSWRVSRIKGTAPFSRLFWLSAWNHPMLHCQTAHKLQYHTAMTGCECACTKAAECRPRSSFGQVWGIRTAGARLTVINRIGRRLGRGNWPHPFGDCTSMSPWTNCLPSR